MICVSMNSVLICLYSPVKYLSKLVSTHLLDHSSDSEKKKYGESSYSIVYGCEGSNQAFEEINKNSDMH